MVRVAACRGECVNDVSARGARHDCRHHEGSASRSNQPSESRAGIHGLPHRFWKCRCENSIQEPCQIWISLSIQGVKRAAPWRGYAARSNRKVFRRSRSFCDPHHNGHGSPRSFPLIRVNLDHKPKPNRVRSHTERVPTGRSDEAFARVLCYPVSLKRSLRCAFSCRSFIVLDDGSLVPLASWP